MIFVRAICCVFVLSLYITSALGGTPCLADEAAVGTGRYCVSGICAPNVQYGVIYRGNCMPMAYARTVGDYCQPIKSPIQFATANVWQPTNTDVQCQNHIPKLVMVGSEYFGHCYAVNSGDSSCEEEDNLVWNVEHFDYCCQPMVTMDGGLILDPNRLNQLTEKSDKFTNSLNPDSDKFINSLNPDSDFVADGLNLIRRHQDTAPQLPSLASQNPVTTKSLSTSQMTEVQPRVPKTISSVPSSTLSTAVDVQRRHQKDTSTVRLPTSFSTVDIQRRDPNSVSSAPSSPPLPNLHARRDIESESSLHLKTPTSQRRPRAKRFLGDAGDFIPCYQDEIALAIAQKCSNEYCFAKYVAMFKQDCQQVAYTNSIGGFCKPEENPVSVNHWWNPSGTGIICDEQSQTPQILTFEGKYYGECYHADSYAPYCQNPEGALWDYISIRYCCVPLVGSFERGFKLDPKRINSKPPKPAAPSLVIQDDPPNQ